MAIPAEKLQRLTLQHDGIQYELCFNFGRVLEGLQRQYAGYIRYHKQGDKTAFDDFPNDPVIIDIIAKTSRSAGSGSDAFHAEHLIEYMIYESFVFVNLVAPGSFSLWGSYLAPQPAQISHSGREARTELSLLGEMFESALYQHNKFSWMKLLKLDFEKALEWMLNVSPRFTMVPESPISRALVSLLHIAKADYGPASVIWIFYALESICQCKVGENFRILTDRITIILGLDKAGKDQLRKELRTLYDLRSSFVHGGLEVVHPMRDEVFDKRADDASWKFVGAIDFGLSLIVLILQNLANRNAIGLTFSETMAVQTIAKS